MVRVRGGGGQGERETRDRKWGNAHLARTMNQQREQNWRPHFLFPPSVSDTVKLNHLKRTQSKHNNNKKPSLELKWISVTNNEQPWEPGIIWRQTSIDTDLTKASIHTWYSASWYRAFRAVYSILVFFSEADSWRKTHKNVSNSQ